MASLLCCTPLGSSWRSWCWPAARTARTTARAWPSPPSSYRCGQHRSSRGRLRPDPGGLGRPQPREQPLPGRLLRRRGPRRRGQQSSPRIDEVSCNDVARCQGVGQRRLHRQAQAKACKLDNSPVPRAGDRRRIHRPSAGLGLASLTVDEAPNAGERLACLAYDTDGSKLDAPLPSRRRQRRRMLRDQFRPFPRVLRRRQRRPSRTHRRSRDADARPSPRRAARVGDVEAALAVSSHLPHGPPDQNVGLVRGAGTPRARAWPRRRRGRAVPPACPAQEPGHLAQAHPRQRDGDERLFSAGRRPSPAARAGPRAGPAPKELRRTCQPWARRDRTASSSR